MKTVVGLFDDMPSVERAVTDIERAGIPMGDISILATEGAVPFEQYRASLTSEDHIARDAQAGGLIGGIAGILLGMTMFAIPGLGPVAAAGWIVTALGGAGIGVAAGGLVGMLINAGIPHEQAHFYDEAVRRGGILLAVRAEENNVAPVESLLRDRGAVDIKERTEEAVAG